MEDLQPWLRLLPFAALLAAAEALRAAEEFPGAGRGGRSPKKPGVESGHVVRGGLSTTCKE